MAEVVEEAVAALGGLDVAMGNAGVAAQLAIVGGDADVWDRTIHVHLDAVLDTDRAARRRPRAPGDRDAHDRAAGGRRHRRQARAVSTRLPPGRHGLSRDEVRASQRARMLIAMTEAVAHAGYAATPVAEVIRRAGVSRATFYDHFTGKEDCFLAAFEGAVDLLADAVRAAAVRDVPSERTTHDAARTDEADPGTAPHDRFAALDAALAAYLEVLAAEPLVARVFLIEVYGAGPAALRRCAEVLKSFVDLVAAVAGDPADPDTRFAAEALTGALNSMVTVRLASGDEASIPDLADPVVRLARRLLGSPER